MAIETNFFRLVMGRFATGITVVTTRCQERLAGITVNSFCSVSLDPPLVLVCIDLNSYTVRCFRDSGSFVVNILTDQQEHLSRRFATSSVERYEHFCHVSYHAAVTGSPIIDDVLAFIDTRIVGEYLAGDHVIFLGQVVALGVGNQFTFANEANTQDSAEMPYNGKLSTDEQVAPLAYYCGQYRHLAQDYQRPSLAANYNEGYLVQVR